MKEKIIKSGSANWFHGIGSKGGKLVLTNKTLYFEGHFFNVGKKQFEVSVKDINNVEVGMPNTLIIYLKDGSSEKFAISGKDAWLEAVQDAMNSDF